MRVASSPFQSGLPEADATFAPASKDHQKAAYSNGLLLAKSNRESSSSPDWSNTPSYVKEHLGVHKPMEGSKPEALIRSKRSPAEEEPKQDITESWGDFQKRHYEWRHPGMTAADPKNIPADEGKHPGPTAGQIALDVITSVLGGGPVMAEEGIKLPEPRPEEAKSLLLNDALANQAAELKEPSSQGNGKTTRMPRAGADASAAMQTDSEAKLQALMDRRNTVSGSQPAFRTVEEFKKSNFTINDSVYLAHVGDANQGLRRAPGADASGDDYLAAIIKHTARTGGSGGEVLSLSNKAAVSVGFQNRSNGHATLFKIDATKNPKAFRSAVDIILNDGPRLVHDKKITPATLLTAVDNVGFGEEEVFYVGKGGSGEIPADIVKQV
jgi:hypothetical protein